MSTEPVNALAKQFAPDAGLTRPCCLPHSRVEPCPQCAARPPGVLPDAALRERQDARRYRWLRAQAQMMSPQMDGTGSWRISGNPLGHYHARSLDAAIDAAMTACPHPLGDIDPQTGHVVCVACGVDVQEEG